ncbi:MAG TPA: NUDIX hydrolase [Polyangiales bacterium]|nr:NUDIX hydrolase [Polyangiales bacterium]
MTDDGLVIGRRVRVEQRRVPRSDGREELREMVVHPGSVVVVPVLDDGRIVMIRNHRFAVGKTLLELCAGTREGDEDPALCAVRELEEETGYRAQTVTPLLSFYPTPGVSDERMFAFVARGLVATQQRLDPSEQIEVQPLALDEVVARISRNEIEDAKTIVSVLYFHTWGASRP